MKKLFLVFSLLSATIYAQIININNPEIPRVSSASSGTALTGFFTSFWKLADTSAAIGSFTLTNSGSPVTFSAGKIGNAGNFVRASSQQLTATTFSFTGPSATIACWIKTTLVGGNEGIFNYTAPDTTVINIRLNTTGNLVFGTNAGGTSLLTSSGTYNDGNWHLIVAYHDSGSGINTMVIDNGSPQTLGSTANPASGSATANIGSNSGAQFWDGMIDACGFADNKIPNASVLTELWNSSNGNEPPF